MLTLAVFESFFLVSELTTYSVEYTSPSMRNSPSISNFKKKIYDIWRPLSLSEHWISLELTHLGLEANHVISTPWFKFSLRLLRISFRYDTIYFIKLLINIFDLKLHWFLLTFSAFWLFKMSILSKRSAAMTSHMHSRS